MTSSHRCSRTGLPSNVGLVEACVAACGGRGSLGLNGLAAASANNLFPCRLFVVDSPKG